MATVVFVTGLVGSGKSHLIRQMQLDHDYKVCEDGFLHEADQVRNLNWLINHLEQGNDCLIAERAFMWPKCRQWMVDLVNTKTTGTQIEWRFFENCVEKVWANIVRDGPTRRNLNGAWIQITNDSLSYVIPPGVTPIPIKTDW